MQSFSGRIQGKSGFSTAGGGAGSIEPPQNWGLREKGSIDGTISQLL